jgi:hypothetical protein
MLNCRFSEGNVAVGFAGPFGYVGYMQMVII